MSNSLKKLKEYLSNTTDEQKQKDLDKINLVNLWSETIEEIQNGTYKGGTKGKPAFKGFSKEEKISYCNKMIKRINNDIHRD